MCIGRFVLPILFSGILASAAWAQEPYPQKPAVPDVKALTVYPPGLPTSPDAADEEITLAQALALALEGNPSLAAFAEEIRARDAATLQAGLWPNPQLVVEVENFAGEGDLEGFEGAETTVALSQLIELGGKREKRRQEAELEKDLAGWDYRTRKLDVLTGTAKAFIEVLAAQQRQAQAEEVHQLSAQTLKAVAARVEAGKVSPVELTRAEVELASARTSASRARHELQSAKSRLASWWGASLPNFQRAVGDLAAIAPLPAEETLYALMRNNPDLERWSTEMKKRATAVSLARAGAVPDLTLGLGVRNLQESGSNALVAGIELPLPLFDRNQGGVGEARASLEKTRRERLAAETEARAGLAEAWQNLAAAHGEATALRSEILPGAQRAFMAAELGYREGKFDFLQMLDAQRTLFEVRGQYLQALAAYHLARTEVERLIGSPLHDLVEPQPHDSHDLR